VALEVLHKALKEACLKPQDIDVICYTKGMIFNLCFTLMNIPLCNHYEFIFAPDRFYQITFVKISGKC
jgi:hypothetical protein